MSIDFNQVPRLPTQPSAPTGGNADGGGDTPSRDLTGLPLYGVLRALNHLLKQQSWARDRLRPHAGRCVRIGVDSSFPFATLAPNLVCRIGEDGLMYELSGAHADVSLWLKPSVQAFFAGLRDGPKGLAGHLRVEGDVLLAGVLGELAQHLRWDIEEDLSRVVGDVAAHRASGAAQSLREKAGQSRDRLSSAAVQYFTLEQPYLVDAISFHAFRDDLAQLQHQVGELARRIG